MRTLYLHIGHGKTGSSFIQASLANSLDVLTEHGIAYPKGLQGEHQRAGNWNISSGNGHVLLSETPDRLEMEGDRILFSSEGLFMALLSDPSAVEQIDAFCAHHTIEEIDVLLFIRDPVSHAASMHQQLVKRGGATYGIEETFEAYTIPKFVSELLTVNVGQTQTRWRVFNYERHRADLIEVLEDWLDLPPDTLARGDGQRVNRSMTAGEVELLSALNARHVYSALRLADALCNKLPDVPAEPVFPDVSVQPAMLDRMAGAISAVNEQIAPSERYAHDLKPETPVEDGIVLHPDQVAVIAEILGGAIADMSNELAELRAERDFRKARALIRNRRNTQAAKVLRRTMQSSILIEDKALRDNLASRAQAILDEAEDKQG